MVSYKMKNCTIEVTGVTEDGQPFRVDTQGDVEIRTKKEREEQTISFSRYDKIFPTAPKYEMVVDLEHDLQNDSVFTIRMEKQMVTKTITAALERGVSIPKLRTRLGVPEGAVAKRTEGVAEIVFTWREEV